MDRQDRVERAEQQREQWLREHEIDQIRDADILPAVPGPSRFSCDICGLHFPRADTLNTHKSRHTTSHSCDICHRPFSTIDVLERHKIIQHGNGKRPATDNLAGPSKHARRSDDKIDHSIKNWWKDDFHEEVPNLAIPHVTYTVEKISQSHNDKYDADKASYRVNFNDIDVEDAGEIIEQLGHVLDNVLNDVAAGAAPHDLMQIVVQDDDLHYPIVLPTQRRDEISVEDLLQQLEKILQSHEEINLDSGLTIDITHLTMPIGAGPHRIKNHADIKTFMQSKHSILQIKNTDDLCCARAIVTGKCKIDRHPKWDSIRKGYELQKDLAEQLHEDAGVPLGPCGLEEIKKFQEVLPTYQLNLVSALHLNKVIYSGPPQDKRIFIYHVDGHYNVITSITGFLCMPYYCEICKIGYSNKERHKCNDPCKCCFKLHEKADDFNWIHCPACDRRFMGQVCFDKHKEPTERNFTTCYTHKRCGTCKKVVDPRHDHHCGQTFCTHCKSYGGPSHECYIQPVDLTPKFDKNGQRLPKDKIQYIFFDFECVQETGVHVPNLCVSHTVCENCLDREVGHCSYCGDRERVFSGPTTLKDFCNWLFVEHLTVRKERAEQREEQRSNDGKKKKKYERKEKTITLCHNFKGYDGSFILQHLYDNYMNPKVIYSGAKIMSLEVVDLDIKFVDSYNFLPLALAKLPAMFDIKELVKGYYPHRHNTIANTNTVLTHLPDIALYNPDSMKKKDRAKFLKWYDDHKNDEFDTSKELLKYCKSDVDILRRCCLKFRHLFMQTTTADQVRDGIDPFEKCMTIAAVCSLVFRANFLKTDTIALIPSHNYHSKQNQSASALRWLRYTAYKENIRIQHVHNGGEYRIGNYPVDGFCADTNTSYQFMGCYWHGCTTCYRPDTINKTTNTPMGELYASTMDTKAYIESRGYTYVEMWECQYNRKLKTDPVMKEYVKGLVGVIDPLVPRDSFFGGRTEGFKLYREAQPNEKIKYVDFTSLYPYVNKYGKYPLGHPKLITENFQALYTCNGLVKCKILPPRSLYLPVLPARINGKLLFALCHTCAETKQQTKCQHNDEERAFVGTWVTDEVNKALEKGYEIVQIYEIWHYERMSQHGNDDMEDGLFTGYINTFLRLKQEASGWPGWRKNEEDRDRYIAEYLAKEGIQLRKDKISKNPGMRSISKLTLNSFWGKYGQRPNLSQTSIIHNTKTYYDLLTDDTKIIQYVNFVNSEIVTITWIMKDSFVDMSDKTNVVVAAYTTAQARLKLYTLLDSLDQRILYADTDSVIYAVKDGEYDPPLGDYLGDLTDELDEGNHICIFATGGPKNYTYKTSQPDGDGNTTHCKVRGITLNYKNSLVINHDIITKMVKGIGPEKVTVTSENQIVRDKHAPTIKNKTMSKDYRVVFDKRVIIENYDTLPYGY